MAKFDEAAFEKEHGAVSVPTISKTESALRGAGAGLTMGLQPYGSAALDTAAQFIAPTNPAEQKMGWADRWRQMSANYRQAVPGYQQQNVAAQQANPRAYMGGEVAGAIPSVISTGGLGAGARATTLGGLSGIQSGATEALRPGSTPTSIATNATIGGVLGAATQAGGEALASGVGKFAGDTWTKLKDEAFAAVQKKAQIAVAPRKVDPLKWTPAEEKKIIEETNRQIANPTQGAVGAMLGTTALTGGGAGLGYGYSTLTGDEQTARDVLAGAGVGGWGVAKMALGSNLRQIGSRFMARPTSALMTPSAAGLPTAAMIGGASLMANQMPQAATPMLVGSRLNNLSNSMNATPSGFDEAAFERANGAQ